MHDDLSQIYNWNDFKLPRFICLQTMHFVTSRCVPLLCILKGWFGINSSFPPLLRFGLTGKHVGLSSGFSSGIFVVTFWLAEVLGWLAVWNPLFYLWRGTVSSSYAFCHCCVYWYDSHINGTSACKSLTAWRHRRSIDGPLPVLTRTRVVRSVHAVLVYVETDVIVFMISQSSKHTKGGKERLF